MKYTLRHLDTCTSDYFAGSHNKTIQVPLHSKSTYLEIKNYLGSYEATEHLDELDDMLYEQAIEDLFYGIKLKEIPKCTRYIEDVTDEDSDYVETVYMFFDIIEEEEEEEEL